MPSFKGSYILFNVRDDALSKILLGDNGFKNKQE